MNIFTVPAVLNVDNSVVDLETIEALYENVSMKEGVWVAQVEKDKDLKRGHCTRARPFERVANYLCKLV